MLKNFEDHYNFNIDQFYKDYSKGPKMFKNREALEPSYIPNELPHRDLQIKDIAEKTACALLGNTPPSFLCYGKTGTGKTATIRYVSQKLAQQCSENKPWWIYINCNIVSTPYRILAHIYNTISRTEKIPPTGLPKDVIFKKLLGLLDQKIKNSICFLVLDEIDILVDKNGGNEILYDLTRLNENLDNCKTCLIGISNILKFKEKLDPRVLSSLGEEPPILFHPYNAIQLKDILKDRSNVAFYEDAVKDGVIDLCAAIAAKEHGDARKALQLLRKAGDLAERAKNKTVSEEFVHRAQKELEKDQVMEYIKGMPIHAQLTLTAIYLLSKFNANSFVIISGYVYDVYAELTEKIPGTKSLTERRLSDYINDLTLAGIINYEIKPMGCYGRTKVIKLGINLSFLENILRKIDKIQDLLDYKPVLLQSDKIKLNNNDFKKLI